MEALNVLPQALELDTEELQSVPAIVELGELRLAYVGGGTGDVMMP